MKEPIPQDPAPWAEKILGLKNAAPFQAFRVVMVSGSLIPVTRPEYVEITPGGSCADVRVPGKSWHRLALEWVVDVEIGGEVGASPRPPRYAAKLRALPDRPLTVTMHDGRHFTLAGPHQFLVSRDGQSVAVCEQDGGLVILETSEIAELEPGS